MLKICASPRGGEASRSTSGNLLQGLFPKSLGVRGQSATQTEKEFGREAAILRTADHHALLRLSGLILPDGETENPPLILPYMSKGWVEDVIRRDRISHVSGETYSAKYIAVFGAALGMACRHSLDGIHHDLKPENTLWMRIWTGNSQTSGC
jgi:serine/threonine protein kinase